MNNARTVLLYLLIYPKLSCITIYYINNLIDHKSLNDNIIYHLQNEEKPSPNSVKSRLSVGFIEEISEIDQALLPILIINLLFILKDILILFQQKLSQKRFFLLQKQRTNHKSLVLKLPLMKTYPQISH